MGKALPLIIQDGRIVRKENNKEKASSCFRGDFLYIKRARKRKDGEVVFVWNVYFKEHEGEVCVFTFNYTSHIFRHLVFTFLGLRYFQDIWLNPFKADVNGITRVAVYLRGVRRFWNVERVPRVKYLGTDIYGRSTYDNSKLMQFIEDKVSILNARSRDFWKTSKQII